MSSSIVEQWRAWVESGLKGPKGFEYVIEHHPVKLEGRQPGLRAETQLNNALEIAFAYPDHPLIRAFARRSYELADWGAQITVVPSYDILEHDRYEARRCKSYTGSMLGLADLDRQLLSGAAEDLLVYMNSGGSESRWDANTQAECLGAVTLFLLAGDTEKAKATLSNKKGFKRHGIWRQGLKEIVALLSKEGGRPMRTSDVPQFEALFQQLRPREAPEWLSASPTISVNSLRLEICLMRYMYVTHRNEPIVWKRVFEQVGNDAV